MKRLFFITAWLGLIFACGAMRIASAQSAPKETMHTKLDPKLAAYHPSGKRSGTLRITGSDQMEELVKYWIEDFKKVQPNVEVKFDPKPSVAVAAAMTSGAADLGLTARELFPTEIKPFAKKFGYEPFPIRAGGGSYRTQSKTFAIAFFVHKSNPLNQISFKQLDAIFSASRRRGGKEAITTWGQLGLTGEWADRPISMYGLKRPNGIIYYLQDMVLGGAEFKGGMHEYTTVGTVNAFDALAQEQSKDPAGIGYGSFSNLTPDLKALALSEKDGGPFYKGTFEEVASWKYPLSRYIYLFANRAPGKPLDPLAKEFLLFELSRQGQQAFIREGEFLPLLSSIASRELKKLK